MVDGVPGLLDLRSPQARPLGLWAANEELLCSQSFSS